MKYRFFSIFKTNTENNNSRKREKSLRCALHKNNLLKLLFFFFHISVLLHFPPRLVISWMSFLTFPVELMLHALQTEWEVS